MDTRSGLSRLLVFAAFFGLHACGGSSNSGTQPAAPAPTSIAAGQSAQGSIGTSGGSIKLTSTEGATFTLTVPEGALSQPTTIRLVTQATVDTQRFNLKLLPAGLIFASGKKAKLDIVLPSGSQAPDKPTIAYDGVPLPYQRTGEVVTASFAGFSVGAGSATSLAKANPFSAHAKSNGEKSALNCTTPQGIQNSDGGLTFEDPQAVSRYGECMLAAVDSLAQSNRYEDAIRVANAAAAYIQSTASTGDLTFIERAGAIACTAHRGVLNRALTNHVTTTGTLQELIRPILFWQMTVEQLGAVCSTIRPTEYTEVINAKIDEAVAYYLSRRGIIVDVASNEYSAALQEARDGQTTVAQVASLQPSQAVTDTVVSQIEQRAQPDLIAAMVPAPWRRCREQHNYDELIRLAQLVPGNASVRAAAQYCGISILAESRESGGSTVDTLSSAVGGVDAGTEVRTGAVSVTADGSLTLSGTALALQCPEGLSSSESLIVRINGVQVASRTASPYLDSPLTLSLSALLSAAGIASHDFTSVALTIERGGVSCGTFWGPAPAPLLTVTLRNRDALARFSVRSILAHDGVYPASACQEPRRNDSINWEAQVSFGTTTRSPVIRLIDRNSSVASGGRILVSSLSSEVIGPTNGTVYPWVSDAISGYELIDAPTVVFTPSAPGSRDGIYRTSFRVRDHGFTNAVVIYDRGLIVSVSGQSADVTFIVQDTDGRAYQCGGFNAFWQIGTGTRLP